MISTLIYNFHVFLWYTWVPTQIFRHYSTLFTLCYNHKYMTLVIWERLNALQYFCSWKLWLRAKSSRYNHNYWGVLLFSLFSLLYNYKRNAQGREESQSCLKHHQHVLMSSWRTYSYSKRAKYDFTMIYTDWEKKRCKIKQKDRKRD